MFAALFLQFYTVLGFILLVKWDGINLVEKHWSQQRKNLFHVLTSNLLSG